MTKKNRLKFYIVDDDPLYVDLITLLLKAAGHSVSSSLAGAIAIPQILSQKPDCVLTDLMMAEMDGLELCRELRERPELHDTKLIVVSARTHEYWHNRALVAGADGYITKPLDKDTFVRQVERLIKEADRVTGSNQA